MAGERQEPHGDGLGERALEPATASDTLSGTGGGAGGGTSAGAGDPSGPGASAGITNPLGLPGIAEEDAEIVSEASALGSSDGALADAAGIGGAGGPTMGEAVGSGPGRDIASGTPGDRGELGGGGASLDQGGGTGPAGTDGTR